MTWPALLENSTVASIVGVIVGFLLATFTNVIGYVRKIASAKNLVFKELSINYEQLVMVVPKSTGINKKITVHLSPDLLVDVADSMHTILYEANAEKCFNLSKKNAAVIVDVYRTINQYKRISSIYRQISATDPKKIGQLAAAVPQSALVAYQKIEEALRLIGGKKGAHFIDSLEHKKGKFTFSEDE